MKATITQIESIVTPSGNSGHVVVPKAWIGKGAIVTLKENRGNGKSRNRAKSARRRVWLIVIFRCMFFDTRLIVPKLLAGCCISQI